MATTGACRHPKADEKLLDTRPGEGTVHVTSWLKKNRDAFDLPEAEWRRVFPGSGRRRRQARPQHGAAGAGVKLRKAE